MATLTNLVDLGRQSASGANLQPLKYILATDPQINERIFKTLGWAAYLKDWPGPRPGERPSAYIIVLHDTRITKNIDCDHGIASQSILLGARELGLAGCMLGAVNRKQLRNSLNIDPELKIMLVLAIGKPNEQAILEVVGPDGDIRYWRDNNQVHHVPKRSLDEIVITRYPNSSD
jgi:nitroreductase